LGGGGKEYPQTSDKRDGCTGPDIEALGKAENMSRVRVRIRWSRQGLAKSARDYNQRLSDSSLPSKAGQDSVSMSGSKDFI